MQIGVPTMGKRSAAREERLMKCVNRFGLRFYLLGYGQFGKTGCCFCFTISSLLRGRSAGSYKEPK